MNENTSAKVKHEEYLPLMLRKHLKIVVFASLLKAAVGKVSGREDHIRPFSFILCDIIEGKKKFVPKAWPLYLRVTLQ